MIDSILAVQGELAALTAAFLWAASAVIFGRLGKFLSPLVLNITKGLIALVFISLTLSLQQRQTTGLGQGEVVLLLASGVIGIGLGDTAYFAALNHLGPRRALLMETLAPPLSAVLALFFLQEQLSLQAWTGILLTLIGVCWVVSERVPTAHQPIGGELGRGIFYGGMAAIGQAAGAVMSRAALANTAVDPLWSTLLRLGGGLVIMVGMLASQGNLVPRLQPLRSGRLLGLVAIAAFFGTYLGIWLQQTALKFAPTGIAQALISTSPLFILPIAALLGERISFRAVLGVLVTLGGIWLLVGYR
ncbi:DMT family transporter [Pseudanabaena sp. FACHB-2040]|uniref:DMT family transporter n=1 Tax=Pseudanabaena sp. FACHB-2040 TaxID=2692859 RepID=UPI00321F711D